MQSALDRRQNLLNTLRIRQHDTVSNLAFEFQVSQATIKRDLCILSRNFPISTSKGHGGGVRYHGENLSREHRLTNAQMSFLRQLSKTLAPADKLALDEIIHTLE